MLRAKDDWPGVSAVRGKVPEGFRGWQGALTGCEDPGGEGGRLLVCRPRSKATAADRVSRPVPSCRRPTLMSPSTDCAQWLHRHLLTTGQLLLAGIDPGPLHRATLDHEAAGLGCDAVLSPLSRSAGITRAAAHAALRASSRCWLAPPSLLPLPVSPSGVLCPVLRLIRGGGVGGFNYLASSRATERQSPGPLSFFLGHGCAADCWSDCCYLPSSARSLIRCSLGTAFQRQFRVPAVDTASGMPYV
ncbi:PREDICTED: heme transporter HRG1 isoform X1 [Chinchilla lanigera]|uniref:heme transporter HRG1 isoform X1 n=1 Tax=Chinchilla lanigera TaxID=34839 RepID=UPI00038EF21C|nr:PREDICTED: heme transporter HRG1 isoform X1 [Chinchilla lanigera]